MLHPPEGLGPDILADTGLQSGQTEAQGQFKAKVPDIAREEALAAAVGDVEGYDGLRGGPADGGGVRVFLEPSA
jgi:hypothetical protein